LETGAYTGGISTNINRGEAESAPVLDASAGTGTGASAGAGAGAGTPGLLPTHVDRFKNLLDESAKQAFARQWHRLERGLRLNRLRLYVEEMTPRCSFNEDEKNRFFNFLQNALDRKLLNTNKIVNYIPEEQKIISIRGLEVKRNVDGTIRWGFTLKKPEVNNQTRRKKTPA
jgi:hypothetical protein